MIRWFVRFAGSLALLAGVLAVPVLSSTTPASADTIVDGCTIVSNPTPTNFTDCPGTNLAGAALAGVDLDYANLANANLSNATITQCTDFSGVPPWDCSSAFFTDTRLTGANLSGVSTLACGNSAIDATGPPCIGSNFSGDDLSGANLTNADLTGGDFSSANLTGANLTGATLSDTIIWTDTPPIHSVTTTLYATLTGTNLTGTLFVPSNQNVTAASNAGAVATWATPAPVPGATPGTCTTPSGSTFPLFSTTVSCPVTDGSGHVATGTFQVHVAPTTQYFTRMLIPASAATMQGSQLLDADAGDAPGVTKVQFELTGGALNQAVVATGTPTIFGWLANWNTTGVPNGVYTLQNVATDVANNVDTSNGVTVTVNNPPPSTFVGLPANNATLKGPQYLDAGASPGVTQVQYEISGGPGNLVDQVISGSVPTYYGWIGGWNTTSVPDGTYTLNSVASYPGGVAGTSAPVTFTVAN
jgi:uncharacterized protein YjbI with pentapeptide repeats